MHNLGYMGSKFCGKFVSMLFFLWFCSNYFVCWRITASDPVDMQISITDIDILYDDDDDHKVYLKDG